MKNPAAFSFSFFVFLGEILSCALLFEAKARGVSIVPRPNEMRETGKTFTLNAGTRILYTEHEGFQETAEFLREMLAASTGLALKTDRVPAGQVYASGNAILLECTPIEGDGKEGYFLRSDEQGVTIRARGSDGAFWGVQSLLQMLPVQVYSKTPVQGVAWTVPGAEIRDKPAYAWRGFMLDCSRQFFRVDEIKRVLDNMAAMKMNIFHWHFIDDNGWRMEIRGYPELTRTGATQHETGSTGKEPKPFPDEGKPLFYSQKEIRDLVAYAHRRHITVMPEIELPGHDTAAIVSYPEKLMCPGTFSHAGGWDKSGARVIYDLDRYIVTDYFTQCAKTIGGDESRKNPHYMHWCTRPMCVGSPAAIQFRHDVFDQMVELFPYSKYIHIGGDEVGWTDAWQHCPYCQAICKERGYKSPKSLRRYVIEDARDYLKKYGKKVMIWAENYSDKNVGVVEGTAGAEWAGGGAAGLLNGCEVTFAPTTYSYFDYMQDRRDFIKNGRVCTLSTVYGYDPMPRKLPDAAKKLVLGSQAHMWTHIVRNEAEMNFMVFPRLCAVAERNWTRKENKSWNGFLSRLKEHYERMRLMGVVYRVPEPTPLVTFASDGKTPVLTFDNPAPFSAAVRYTLDGTEPNEKSPAFDGAPIPVKGSFTVKALTVMNDPAFYPAHRTSHVVSKVVKPWEAKPLPSHAVPGKAKKQAATASAIPLSAPAGSSTATSRLKASPAPLSPGNQ